jgi:amidohydrolase
MRTLRILLLPLFALALACGEDAEAPAPAPEPPAAAPAEAPEAAREPLPVPAPVGERAAQIDRLAAEAEPQVIAWRRHIHRHPELSNREFETAKLVADALEDLGIEVRTGVAHTGVVGILRGGAGGDDAGRRVALRADMDALPVVEQTGLPFASTVRTTYDGREVGVMHACGHDAHVAMLLGAARVLAAMQGELSGTVLFVFQPAEEGAPQGEEGGARLMLEEGVFDPPPDAVFGIHVTPDYAAGEIGWRSGGVMASSDRLDIAVRGRQTHAAYPWRGIDPVAAAARIVLALQAIPARRVDARVGSIVSIGAVHGGVRHNIIPDEVALKGTIRSLDPEMRFELHRRVRSAAENAAAVDGASAEVTISLGYPVTYNDDDLVRRSLPTLRRVAGAEQVVEGLPRTGAEDFSFFAEKVPGFYFWLGTRPRDVALQDAAPNHSPLFVVDERALVLGVRTWANLAFDFLGGGAAQ